MSHRVFVHVGTPKSGTSFLQSVLWSNRSALATAGLLLPLDSVEDHYRLSKAGPPTAGATMSTTRADGAAAWRAMADQVARWHGDVLISHELFSHARRGRVEWMRSELDWLGEVHIVVTARDLARQIPAAWQQSVKQGRAHRLADFYEQIRDNDPTLAFWRGQDLPKLVSTWGAALASGRVHVVTVPPAGSDPQILWRRFAGLVGVDSLEVDLAGARPNESLSWSAMELIRRVNDVGDTDLPVMAVRTHLVPALAARGLAQPHSISTPVEHHPWVMARAAGMVRWLGILGCDVVGSLDDLVPVEGPLADLPPDPADSTLLTTAVEAIDGLLRRPPTPGPPPTTSTRQWWPRGWRRGG